MPSPQNAPQKDQLEGLISLAINIIIPTLTLKYLSPQFGNQGPLIALIVAFSFPLTYGIYDFKKSRKSNPLSILGVINTLLTGGFALFQLEGIWFAVKEASIPLVIGIAVFVSAFTNRPLVNIMVYNENLINLDKVNHALESTHNTIPFKKLLKNATLMLSLSFLLSTLLNFFLAKYIFVEIPPHLNQVQKSMILNDQIAQMTWKSYFIIAIPCLVFISGIIWYIVRGIKKLTGLELPSILRNV